MDTHTVLDADTARDIQVKLALAAEFRKQKDYESAAYWLGRAERSTEEFKRSQTAD